MKLTAMVRPAIAGALLAGLVGCASTHHYYSATDYQGVRVGAGRVTSGVSVGISPSGISITPRVRYHQSRTESPQ